MDEVHNQHNIRCLMCPVQEDNPIEYGELLPKDAVSDQTHYYCALFSKAPQNGIDIEEVNGILIKDIKYQIKAYNKTKCSLCYKRRAASQCHFKSCKKNFHVSCAIKKHCLLQFVEPDFKVFCKQHSIIILKKILSCNKLLIYEEIEKSVRSKKNLNSEEQSMKVDELKSRIENRYDMDEYINKPCHFCAKEFTKDDFENNFIILPCCWSKYGLRPNYTKYVLHKTCIKHQAYVSGYRISCPFCSNNERFRNFIQEIGVYVPNRHALWEHSEIENFSLLGVPAACSAEICLCPDGRIYDESQQVDEFYIFICNMCGSNCIHRLCLGRDVEVDYQYQCNSCVPQSQEASIEHVGSVIDVHDSDSETGYISDDVFKLLDRETGCVPKPIPLPPKPPLKTNHFRYQCEMLNHGEIVSSEDDMEL